MSQKVNPIAVRLRLNRLPDSSWFSDYYYSKLLYQDLNFREYVIKIRSPTSNKLGFRPGKCIIHLSPKKTRINLFCLSNISSQQSEENFARDNNKESIFITKYQGAVPTVGKTEQSVKQNFSFVLPGFSEQKTILKSSLPLKAQRPEWPSGFFKSERRREEDQKKRLSHIVSTACRTNSLKKKTIANYFREFTEIRRNTLASLARMDGNKTNNDAHQKDTTVEQFHNIALVNNLLDIYNIRAEVNMELDSNNSLASDSIKFKVPPKGTSIPLVALDFSKFSYEVFHKMVEQTIQQKKTSEIEMRSWLLSICGLSSVLAEIKEPLWSQKQQKHLSLSQRHDFFFNFLAIYYFFVKFTHVNQDLGWEYSIKNPLSSVLFFTSFSAKKHLMTPVLLSLIDNSRRKDKVENLRTGPTGRLWSPSGQGQNKGFSPKRFNTLGPTGPKGPQSTLAATDPNQRRPDICFENKFFYLANLQSSLNKITNTTVRCEILKIGSIYQSANFIAQEIACKLEQKKSFRQTCRSIFQQITLCKYIKGIRISCSGRLNGAEIAKTECRKYGETSLHVFSDKIDYAYTKAAMPYGILGIKVWVSYI